MIEMSILKNIASVDISNVDKKSKENEQKVYLCNFVDVYRNWEITNSLAAKFMTATANENQIKRFSIHKGQVAITKDSETRNDIGVAAYIADDLNNTVLGYHCALITPNENYLLGEYLNVILHTSYAQKYFEANASGSGQRYTLTNDIIGGFPVPLPTISEQYRISHIFSLIDKQIANNKAICAELESMAKLLYDYWFVQFDFPDENGKPYKSSGGKMVWNQTLKRGIPEEWKVCTIASILGNYPKTTSVIREEYSNGSSFPIIDQSKEYICGYTDDSTKVLHMKDAIVYGDHTNCVKYVNFDFARGADGTQIINSNNSQLPNYLLYQQICSLPVIEKGYSRHYKFLKEQYVIIPNGKTSELFINKMKDSLSYKRCIIEENRQLTLLRDFLLSMLMNGQVKIRES